MADPRILELPLGAVTQDTGNANRGTERGKKALAHSLATYGAGRSILLDSKNRIISGNKTAREAQEAGFATVRVIETDGSELVAVRRIDLDLDEPRARALAFADNRVAELDLEWDAQAIDAALKAEIDLSHLWTGDELEALLKGLPDPGSGLKEGADLDAVPDSAPARVKPGELWELGRHRLLCGDSTKAEDVGRLMDGEEADLCFTSPPYDQQRTYGGGIGDWLALMQGVFGNLPMAEKGQVLINLGMVHRDGEWRPYWDPWIAWMREQGWRSFGWYVWDQGPGLPGDWNGRLAPAHEFIFHFNRVAERARKSKETRWANRVNAGKGLRGRDGVVQDYTDAGKPVQERKIPDSVVRVMRHKARGIEVGHPAVFPVALVAEIMQAFSDLGDLCFEPFAGSGTALIAGQDHGRTVVALEREPSYCDIALQRFEQVTGLSPRRISQ